MNNFEQEVLALLCNGRPGAQRELAAACCCSVGKVNQTLRSLREQGLLSVSNRPTAEALGLFRAPRHAVILAAGFGLRMIPINNDRPKGLLRVRGEVLIERLIRQLKEVGVSDITVVVGFMKEQYEYLIDTFGVNLLVNPEYAVTGSCRSLLLAANALRGGGYILPCDLWCEENPFRPLEYASWYMMKPGPCKSSRLYVPRSRALAPVPAGAVGDYPVGIAWLAAGDTEALIASLSGAPADAHWEDAPGVALDVFAARLTEREILEINTYEQLRSLDPASASLSSDALDFAAAALKVSPYELEDISISKAGMTNRSFFFRCRGQRYMMRVPGEGTDRLIDRAKEYAVYQTILPYRICDDVVCMDPVTGYKISVFLDNARVCDPRNPSDVAAAMGYLRRFHERGLTVPHRFDLFGQIDYYESLRGGRASIYHDYDATKAGVMALRPYIESLELRETLTHIDAVPDNFLFTPDGIRLIDWEYAGMQDPHVDIAMFIVYAMLDRDEAEAVIDAYFPEGAEPALRRKIYAYVAMCGMLWSNWCEYKYSLGVDFGEYSLRQYRYAKDYVRLFHEKSSS